MDPNIHESWKQPLMEEFNKPYFADLKEFLVEDKSSSTIYPPGPLIFNAFNKTPWDRAKVVIIGQDPYHGKGQAMGLCFSVPEGIKPPPSLVNIFKEIRDDLGADIPNHGNLEYWAMQGVFLLNATLTVRAGQAGSHQGKGWETFTDAVIKKLSDEKENLVFLLWGRFAQNKSNLIDTSKHHVLEAAHPSPFSAYNGFFGCRHFSKANSFLEEDGFDPIDWRIPDVL
ncbi:MAG TPA: uracil-DNA glycosylase [Bacteroidales bacterium]|nr:uracil-DNA glycosylase [Bacteroidales bacterium]